ncbi:SRPBCC domain-containing protein [Aquimarina longa]|uniref:SRPBCC domain-containing protein n=1 Tax=Aquimarina longa TaxID=1080221 RepID=UPI000AFF8437|nr:SRPBCC domain-containing protein [Aquimarina longa]
MKEYKIEIKINASKETVWKTITNFKEYPNWNTILEMEQNEDLVVGKKFKVTIYNPKGKKSKFNATTMHREDNVSFSATQKIIGKWFFSATHYFIIREIDKEHVVFIQKWKLRGLITSLFYKQICKELKSFNAMNTELKTVLEK